MFIDSSGSFGDAGDELLEGLYGSPEQFLAVLEEQACDCEFCASRAAWLRGELARGVVPAPPYIPGVGPDDG